MGVQSRVNGPQPGVRLAHGADGIFHRARSHGPTAGRDAAIADPLCKELEKRDGVAWEAVRIDVERIAEGRP